MIDILVLTAVIYFILSLTRDLLFPETLPNHNVSDPSDTPTESE